MNTARNSRIDNSQTEIMGRYVTGYRTATGLAIRPRLVNTPISQEQCEILTINNPLSQNEGYATRAQIREVLDFVLDAQATPDPNGVDCLCDGKFMIYRLSSNSQWYNQDGLPCSGPDDYTVAVLGQFDYRNPLAGAALRDEETAKFTTRMVQDANGEGAPRLPRMGGLVGVKPEYVEKVTGIFTNDYLMVFPNGTKTPFEDGEYVISSFDVGALDAISVRVTKNTIGFLIARGYLPASARSDPAYAEVISGNDAQIQRQRETSAGAQLRDTANRAATAATVSSLMILAVIGIGAYFFFGGSIPKKAA